ncbi:hypothetical protein NA78x_001256 [Anatilimnocola sp. NA78]|uniref:hypothetical protein n=1 Tax=Anatilimnocola sp. NA78 TaxID=3415683 RepID=UPI003CE50C10
MDLSLLRNCVLLWVASCSVASAAIFDGDLVHVRRSTAADSTAGEYSNDDPTYGGALSGGEFVIDATGGRFKTFCLEYSEHIGINQQYLATVDQGAISGGLGGSVNGIDPLSGATQWFYRAYRTSSLDEFMGPSGFDYDNDKWAESLQLLFWRLEDELPNNASPWAYTSDSVILSNANKLWGYYLDHQSFLDAYDDLDVQVVNLWKPSVDDWGKPLYGMTDFSILEEESCEGIELRTALAPYRAQSQLYYSAGEDIPPPAPTPEPASLIIWGSIAALGAAAYRRSRVAKPVA